MSAPQSTWRGLRRCDRIGQVAETASGEGRAEDRGETNGETGDDFRPCRADTSTGWQVVPEVHQGDPGRDDFSGLAEGARFDPVHDHSHGRRVAGSQDELAFDFNGLLITGLEQPANDLLPIDRR